MDTPVPEKRTRALGTTRLRPSTVARIDAWAAHTGVSRAHAIDILCRVALDAYVHPDQNAYLTPKEKTDGNS